MWTDDEYLAPFGDLVEELCDVEAILGDDEQGGRVRATRLALEMPVELGLVPVEGGVLLGIVPPVQRIEASVMPVFHRLRVVVTPDGDG